MEGNDSDQYRLLGMINADEREGYELTTQTYLIFK